MLVCWHPDPSQRPTFQQLAKDIRDILHQLELEQQQLKQNIQQASINDKDTVVNIEQLSNGRNIRRLSAASLSSIDSATGQYITTPHRQSENTQLLFDRDGDEEDSYAVAVNSSADMFSTTRLLPRYTETSLVEDP